MSDWKRDLAIGVAGGLLTTFVLWVTGLFGRFLFEYKIIIVKRSSWDAFERLVPDMAAEAKYGKRSRPLKDPLNKNGTEK